MNNLYEIKDLQCKYPTNDYPVLIIGELDIAKGSRTFFIGASGVGKSTILETLGLMNNTIFNENGNSKFIFKNSSEINLINLWNKKESEISKFRREHLSFVFQNTNLFNNLSAFENISIASILEGKSRKEAVEATKKAVRKILPNLTSDKSISQLSGGQRQRIAFARAIVNNYTVLFADEPTGNLDIANARNLMNILMENTENKTTIIVTHDIELAGLYADQVVLINKKHRITNEGKSYFGEINNDFNFKRLVEGGWKSNKLTFKDTQSFLNYLKEILIQQAG